ncbi:hypothetical protein ACWGIA_23535 [Streptomyces bobili]
MEAQIDGSTEEAYRTELTAFARELKDLQLACEITYREVGRRSPSVVLSASGVSQTLRGKRLPSRDFLLALVRVLYEVQDGQQVGHDDPRLRKWEERRKRLSLLRDRARQSGARVSGPDTFDESAAMDRGFVPPPDGATLLELESAKSDLRGILNNLHEHEQRVRGEFRQVLDEQTRVAAELSRLTALLERERDGKEKLERKVESLKRQRAELGRQLDDLRARFAEIDADRVALLKEESALNDRRAVVNFDWARYEEFLRQRADAEVIRLRDELARTRTDPDSTG